MYVLWTIVRLGTGSSACLRVLQGAVRRRRGPGPEGDLEAGDLQGDLASRI